jgi:putative ATP-dependent endonuclease of the OLD family
MYLSRVEIENYRIFGEGREKLDLPLQKGLNLILGENNSGKSALMDAIRLLLGTRDNEWLRITPQDFHISGGTPTDHFNIRCTFEDLDEQEAAEFLEWLEPITDSNPETKFRLVVRLTAIRKDETQIQGRFDRSIRVEVKAGSDVEGKAFDGQARENLRTTYLKPLRDAEQELGAKRGSRLSQILANHPEMRDQHNQADESTLVGIAARVNTQVREHSTITQRVDDLNQNYLQHLTLADDQLNAQIAVAPITLRGILERLALSLAEDALADVRHGLGLDNLLFIATEFLLLQGPNAPLRLALIEEPEAHLHPQLQLRLVSFLEELALTENSVQVLLTSHSPHLASTVNLERVVLMRSGTTYPLTRQHTRLEPSDYAMLRHFLDVTRANLFFARGVLIVEGVAEQLLLPVIAEAMGRSFSKYGVSIVNVMSAGLSRYARIFHRSDNSVIDIQVACVMDRDIPPLEAKAPADGKSRLVSEDRETVADLTAKEIQEQVDQKIATCSGGNVRAFVSPTWTLEYDLAAVGWGLMIYIACELARERKPLTDDQAESVILNATTKYKTMRRKLREKIRRIPSDADLACLVYTPLAKGSVSKAEAAYQLGWLIRRNVKKYPSYASRFQARLPHYLVEAIQHVTRFEPPSNMPIV